MESILLSHCYYNSNNIHAIKKKNLNEWILQESDLIAHMKKERSICQILKFWPDYILTQKCAGHT